MHEVNSLAASAGAQQWIVDSRRPGSVNIVGTLGMADLPRLAEEAIQAFEPFAVTIESARSPRGVAGLRLRAAGSILLTCQRCMQPVTLELSPLAEFELAEAPAGDGDDGDDAWDVLEHSDHLDLRQLVEDELMLALPYAPKHEACVTDGATAAGEKVTPFAALSALVGARRV